ncbi:MAG: carbohydrate binding family 9 domain-containing protein, partial [Vicinamibacteria bacterium]
MFVLSLLTLPPGAVLAAAPTRTLSVGNVDEGREPKIDGLVTDDAWLAVDPYKGFTQQEPIEGAPASEETEVRILLGGTTLYIGIIAFDSEPDKILVTESRRDGELNETDSIQIVLDTFNDNQNAFLFGTNPAGLEYDGQVAA